MRHLAPGHKKHQVLSCTLTTTMKIVGLLVVLLALSYGFASHRCDGERRRSERRFWSHQRNFTTCGRPNDSLVQLKVPEGFDYVKPSVVKIPQCTGLFCSTYKTQCLPTDFIERELIVEAYKAGKDHLPQCVTVPIQEHVACECDCQRIEKCPQNQEFDESSCECKCDPNHEAENKCRWYKWDFHDKYVTMQWSKAACQCKCVKTQECDDTMVWEQGICRCLHK